MVKRGTISLETIVKTLPHIAVFIFLLAAASIIYSAFFTKATTEPQRDLARIASEMQSLSPGEKFAVFLTGSNYQVALYGADSAEKPTQCSTKPCVCVFETSGATKCEVLKAANSKECISSFVKTDSALLKTCQLKVLCVDNTPYPVIQVPAYDASQPRQSIVVCKACSKLAIGADECANLVG